MSVSKTGRYHEEYVPVIRAELDARVVRAADAATCASRVDTAIARDSVQVVNALEDGLLIGDSVSSEPALKLMAILHAGFTARIPLDQQMCISFGHLSMVQGMRSYLDSAVEGHLRAACLDLSAPEHGGDGGIHTRSRSQLHAWKRHSDADEENGNAAQHLDWSLGRPGLCGILWLLLLVE
ncbi:hypothetical protein PG990_010561 [Apiospora arundinis]